MFIDDFVSEIDPILKVLNSEKKQRTSSDFNENQPKEGRKIFYFFNFVSWYQNHE